MKEEMSMLKKRNQKGFTLIEIIAVLVILGILAAVAIPKYMDMQANARNSATTGALGNASGEVSLRYANLILTGGGATVTMAALATALNASSTRLGDYDFTYAAAGTTGISISVTAVANGVLGTPTTKTVVVN
jgi:MSHA pilin protein MshA